MLKTALWFAIAVGAVLVVRLYWRAAGETEDARRANKNPMAAKHDPQYEIHIVRIVDEAAE